MRIIRTLSFSALLMAIQPLAYASAFIDTLGEWTILQIHKSFDPERSHEKCTAVKTSGPTGLVIQTSRMSAIDPRIDDGIFFIKVFDPSIPEPNEGQSRYEVTVSVDGREITSKQAEPLIIFAADRDPSALTSLYAMTEPGDKSFSGKPSSKSPKIYGLKISLNRNETSEIMNAQQTIKFSNLTSEFPATNILKATYLTEMCNKNTVKSEYQRNKFAGLEPQSPFSLILGEDIDKELTQEEYLDKVESYVSEVSIAAHLEEIRLLSEQDISRAGLPASTQFAWQGQEGAFGRVSFHPFNFDSERELAFGSHLYDCRNGGGTAVLDYPMTLKVWDMVFISRGFICLNNNSDPNKHYLHYTRTSHSFLSGDALVMDEGLWVNGTKDNALEQFDQFKKATRMMNLAGTNNSQPKLPFKDYAGEGLKTAIKNRDSALLPTYSVRCAAALGAGIRYEVFPETWNEQLASAQNNLLRLAASAYIDPSLSLSNEQELNILDSEMRAEADIQTMTLDYMQWFTEIDLDARQNNPDHPYVKEVMGCMEISQLLNN